MNPVSGYSIIGYAAMVADNVRMTAYAAALRTAVKKNSIVMDIGAGTGIWSMLACQYGARHVYAIEPNDSICTARELAKANGCADRITFVQDISTRIELPERANVIVSDLRGTLPFFEQHITSIADARTRHLAPGGTLIPQRDTVWACLVEAPECYERHLSPWGKDILGLDFSSNRRAAVNAFHHDQMKPQNLLVLPQALATLDYRSITNPDVCATLRWTAERAGTAHGICLWFDAELADGIGFSNEPGQAPLVYGMAMLLLTEPVPVAVGDVIAVDFKGDLVGEKYIWQWNTQVFSEGKRDQLKANFKQSTFGSSTLDIEQIRKRAATFVPQASADGAADRFVLNMMDGTNSLEGISHRLSAEFPEQYATWQDALGHVGELSLRYSR